MKVVAALKNLQPWFAWAPPWAFTLALAALALAAAVAVHAVLVHIVRRSLSRGDFAFWRALLVRTRTPALLAMMVAALSAALAASPLTARQAAFVQHVFVIAFIVLVGWAVVIAIDIAAAVYLRRFRTDVADNLLARKHVTQVRILQRAAMVAVVVLTAALALMTINQVRQWGVSLLAAGGAATVIVGLALQPLLSNLIAGIQIAITQPIRLDDQVIVENEFGFIEEITATYVVVRVWDDRRILLPLTYFLQKPFQNWTRETARLLGTVMLYVDYTTPIEPLRARLTELLEGDSRWDRRVGVLQVTDAKERTLELRCLMSAANPGQLFDLRCAIRESMIAYLRESCPGALPRDRLEMAAGLPRIFGEGAERR